MISKFFAKTVLLVISTACVANAYIVPAELAPLPGYEEPFPGDNSSPCENPYEPCEPQYPGNPYEPQPNEPQYPDRPDYGQGEVKRVFIGRSVRNERLPLRELAGLNSAYRGYEVVSVRGRTRPNSSATTIVQLVADGRVIASQTNPGYQIDLRPNIRAELGTVIRSLQLAVSGSTYIDDLEIEVVRGHGGGGGYEPPPHYGQQRVDIAIHRSTYGNDRIDLTQYMNLSQYRGLAIQEVIVTGASEFQTSFVELIINSFNYGQATFSQYRQSQSIRLNNRPVIGRDASSIVLYTRGNMSVERVTLVLSR